MPEHRIVTPAAAWLLPRSGRNFLSIPDDFFCIDTIGISLQTNRDFPTLLSILFCTFVVEKERDTNSLTL